jgi:hypothetical protein
MEVLCVVASTATGLVVKLVTSGDPAACMLAVAYELGNGLPEIDATGQ